MLLLPEGFGSSLSLYLSLSASLPASNGSSVNKQISSSSISCYVHNSSCFIELVSVCKQQTVALLASIIIKPLL